MNGSSPLTDSGGVSLQTRDRILDAAERLFAQQGFERATMRAIAVESDEGLGTLTYHFPSKTDILIAAIRRRLDDLAMARRAAYESAMADGSGDRSMIRLAVFAIVFPYAERSMTGPPYWRHYTRLLARVLASGGAQYYQTVSEIIAPYAEEFLGWVERAAPDAAPEAVALAYQFLIGSMLDCCTQFDLGRFERIAPGTDFDAQTIIDRLIRYITAGVEAILADGPAR